MKIIAIETSTEICGIAYIENGNCVDIVEDRIPRQHAEKLPLFYNKLIDKTGLKLSEIDAIAISIGPGSFTGLRIGLSYSKGLAYSHNKPIVPVPTIQSIISGVDKNSKNIVAMLLSHGNKYFFQQFNNNNGVFVSDAIEVYELNNITELKDRIHDSNIIHFGCDKLFEGTNLDNHVIEIYPSARLIGELAHQNYDKWIVNKPYKLVPDYVSPFKIG